MALWLYDNENEQRVPKENTETLQDSPAHGPAGSAASKHRALLSEGPREPSRRIVTLQLDLARRLANKPRLHPQIDVRSLAPWVFPQFPANHARVP